jgi:hypothetical protein
MTGIRMSAHRARKRHRRFVASILEKKRMEACEITMLWQTVKVDQDDESNSEEPREMSQKVTAMVKYVSVEAVTRQAAEWEAGDAIITLSDKVTLEDKHALRFVLPDDGVYVQRRTGQNAEPFWEAILGGRPVGKTFLLRRSQ